MNNEMKKEIVTLLSKDVLNLKASFELTKTLYDVKIKLIEQLEDGLQEIAKNSNWKVESEGEWGKSDSGFYIYPNKWKTCKIFFWFDKSEFNNFYYGVQRNSEEDLEISEIREILGWEGPNGLEICWKWFEPQDWDGDDAPWVDIINKKMKHEITSLVEDIINKLKKIENKL